VVSRRRTAVPKATPAAGAPAGGGHAFSERALVSDPGAAELEIDDVVEAGKHRLALTGELDLATADEFESAVRQICADRAEELVLHLGGLVFMDSVGLRALMEAMSMCEQHGCSLRITHAREPVKRLFDLTGVAEKLPFVVE
jgi:anti-sigma B factor antagonist